MLLVIQYQINWGGALSQDPVDIAFIKDQVRPDDLIVPHDNNTYKSMKTFNKRPKMTLHF